MWTRPSPAIPVSTTDRPAPGGPILVEAGDDLAEQLWHLARARGETPEILAADLLRRGLEKEARRKQAESALAALTPRQREVTRLAISGQTNRQIARALWLSPETVKTHLRRALEHFDLHSKAELRLLLIDLGDDIKNSDQSPVISGQQSARAL
ncbi:MAG TPA: LuxR C-terminal-related transcriptional regulator [Anaerolineales bacterium]|nr:LuxR C-terminal-related transcriptional regulator [Anaerolineales bacterium]